MLQRRPIHNGNRKKNAIKAHKKPKQLILTANDDNIISSCLFLPHSTDEASASFKRVSVQFAYFGFCHICSCSITLLLGFVCFFLFAGGLFFFILVGVHVNPQRNHTDALPEVICIIVV